MSLSVNYAHRFYPWELQRDNPDPLGHPSLSIQLTATVDKASFSVAMKEVRHAGPEGPHIYDIT